MKNHLELQAAIQNLDSIPPLPAIAQQILALDLSDEDSEEKMFLLIEQDPIILARVIGLANSPLVGSARRVSTVKHSVLLMGVKKVRAIALGLAAMSTLKTPFGKLDDHALWAHNFEVAFSVLPIIHAMPAKYRPSDDIAFLSGMIHDIGYSALAILDLEHSDELQMRLITDSKMLGVDIEREMVGVTHEVLGAELALHWNLPDEVAEAIRFHHSVSNSQVSNPLARVINLAEKLLDSASFKETIDHSLIADDLIALGISPEEEEEIKHMVMEHAVQANSFYGSIC